MKRHVAALKKRGHCLAGLSVTNGYHPTAAGKALKQPWPTIEQLLAAAIGVTPQEIWPSRYDRQGNPRKQIQIRSAAGRKSAVVTASLVESSGNMTVTEGPAP